MKISLASPVINDEMITAATEALQNERCVLGESVYKFEEEFAKYFGVKYAISVNSGNTALMFAYISLGVKSGDEVVTPSATFIATAASCASLGAKPVFAEISKLRYTLDPKDVRLKITEKTKVITPVHLYGFPAEMDSLMDISEDKNIPILEDCAQSHGAIYRGKKTATLGTVAIFSFYTTKNMTVCGDGGMVITDDDSIAETIRKLRDNGRKSKNIHDIIGYTARLNNVNAAIGRIQLRYLDKWNEKRRKIADIYYHNLRDIEEIELPVIYEPATVPVYHLYVIKTHPEIRNLLGAYLEKNGIQTSVHYPIPLHLQPVFRNLGYKRGDLPITEEWSDSVLTLPMHVNLEKDDIIYICENIKEFFREKAYSTDPTLRQEGKRWIKSLM